MTCDKRFVIILSLFVLSICCSPKYLFGESQAVGTDYGETIKALKSLYRSEIMTVQVYSTFSREADEEGYQSVSRLFSALSASEEIHANNFKSILSELGINVVEQDYSHVKSGDVKSNLRWALRVELSEIDHHYPKLIEQIEVEGHKKAILDIRQAWRSEMQHRVLVEKMQSALRFFFGKVIDRLREAKHYYVCQRCGSTVFQLPDEYCVICESPVSLYILIK